MKRKLDDELNGLEKKHKYFETDEQSQITALKPNESNFSVNENFCIVQACENK